MKIHKCHSKILFDLCYRCFTDIWLISAYSNNFHYSCVYIHRESTRGSFLPTQIALTRHETLSNLIVVHSDNHHTYRAHLFPIHLLCDRHHLLHMYSFFFLFFALLNCPQKHGKIPQWMNRKTKSGKYAKQFKYSVQISWRFHFDSILNWMRMEKMSMYDCVLLVGNIQTQPREPNAFISPSFETKKKNGKYIWLHWKLHSSG